MSEIAIRAENLSKSYQITRSTGRASYRTLQEEVVHLVKRPFKRNSAENRRETFWALKDISFEVKHGEVLGIIGRNGAGKSTLLKILSRITKPTSGRADIYGRVGSLLEVGTGFHPELTGRENVYLNGAVLGMSRRDIRNHFDEIVAFAEVEQFLDTPVKRYSSGMYMRLAFAVAAHLEPEVLVVDEVLAVGDAKFQEKCLGKMRDVAKGGRTVIFVSHNMGAIMQLCTRCLMLSQGSLLVDDTPHVAINTYLNNNANEHPVLALKPQETEAYFTSIGTLSSDDTAKSTFAVTEPIKVWIGFEQKRNVSGLQLGVAVLNYKSERVFYSSNAYNEPPVIFDDQLGEQFVSVQIPAKLLPPGHYALNIALHRPNISMFDYREHVISFDVEETGSGREEFYGQDIGYVLVDLKWKHESEIPNVQPTS